MAISVFIAILNKPQEEHSSHSALSNQGKPSKTQEAKMSKSISSLAFPKTQRSVLALTK